MNRITIPIPHYYLYCSVLWYNLARIVEVTTMQEYRISVIQNDRWEQRFSLYIRQIYFMKILKLLFYFHLHNIK